MAVSTDTDDLSNYLTSGNVAGVPDAGTADSYSAPASPAAPSVQPAASQPQPLAMHSVSRGIDVGGPTYSTQGASFGQSTAPNAAAVKVTDTPGASVAAGYTAPAGDRNTSPSAAVKTSGVTQTSSKVAGTIAAGPTGTVQYTDIHGVAQDLKSPPQFIYVGTGNGSTLMMLGPDGKYAPSNAGQYTQANPGKPLSSVLQIPTDGANPTDTAAKFAAGINAAMPKGGGYMPPPAAPPAPAPPPVDPFAGTIGTLAADFNNPSQNATVQAVDQNTMNTLNAQNSALSTSAYQSGNNAAAGQFSASQQAGESGAGALGTQQAVATAQDNDLQDLSKAMTDQANGDTQFTAAQQNSEISGVQDAISGMQAALGSMDAATQTKVKGQLDNLTNLVNQYKNSTAQSSGDFSTFLKLAGAALATIGGVVLAPVTGGVSLVGAGAADAALLKS